MCNISTKIFTIGVVVSLSALSVQSTSAIEGLLKGTHYVAKQYLTPTPTFSNLKPENVIKPYNNSKDNGPTEVPYLEPLHPVALGKLLKEKPSNSPSLFEIINFRPFPGTGDWKISQKYSLLNMPRGNRLGMVEVSKIYEPYPEKVNILSLTQFNEDARQLKENIWDHVNEIKENFIVFTKNSKLFSCDFGEIFSLPVKDDSFKDAKFLQVFDLDKFQKKEKELETLKDHFYYFLKHAPHLSKPHEGAPPVIIDMYKLLQSSNWDSKEIEEYNNIEKVIVSAANKYNFFGVELKRGNI